MSKKIPVRRCVGCQEMKGKKEMIRVIRTPEGDFLLDATGKVLIKQGKIKGWSVLLNRRFRKRCMRHWKRRWRILTGNKVLSLIGLATKAGKTASGEFLTEREVKSGKAALVIVAGDASENTKKKFRNMCD